MASLTYKNHRVIVSTVPHRYTKRWSWAAVVTWSENDRQKVHPIKNWFQQFDDQAQAETCAIEAAIRWIDKHLEILPHGSSVPKN